MRVAYVCADPGVPVWGNKGCSIHVQEIVRSFVRDNIYVDLIGLQTGGHCPTNLNSVKLHLIGGQLPSEPDRRERACPQLNYDIHGLLSALGPFDVVYERHALWSYAGVEFAKNAGIPGVLEVNAPLIEEQATHRRLIDREGAIVATRRAFDAASAILPVSEDVATYVRSHCISSGRIYVLPNAVNPAHFDNQSRYMRGDSNGAFTIGFVGSLKPWHGVDQLITAYEKLWSDGTAWRLLIAGDGPERERLESLALGLPARIAASIEFLGMMSHAEIPCLLAKLDAAVAPGVSSDPYFSPLKLFEYMAAGVPVVAARLRQNASLIQQGVTGLLYNPDDWVDLARAILHLRSNPALAARMGEAARREVLANHTWDHRREAIMRIVRSAIRSHAHSAS